MTLEEEERFIQIRDAVDADKSQLSRWEKGFLYEDSEDAEYPGLFVSYEQHGSKTRVSPKQWQILSRIASNYGIIV